MSAKIAILGRPNVGKSTLFNRLVGRRLALVDDEPGVTRDRREGTARLGELEFLVVDTPGIEEGPERALTTRMARQAEKAAAEADACLFLIDAKAGVTPLDKSFGRILRAAGKPVILLANKADARAAEAGVLDAWSLGLGEPIAISAEHGEGLNELYAAIKPHIKAADALGSGLGGDEAAAWNDAAAPLRIAIVGRPNVGKSTLVNRLIGEERVLTGPEPGITRDAIAVDWVWRDKTRDWPVKFYDTAGLRKKAKVTGKLEKLSVADAIRAVRFAEIVILLLDAKSPFEKQDLQIADLVVREGRALVIAVNKWDLVEDKIAASRAIRETAERRLTQAAGVPIVFFSAQTGENVDDLMPAAAGVYADWNARVKTKDLNDWLKTATERNPPPAVAGRRLKIRYIAQTKTRPPTFVAQCARAAHFPESYRRYLVNGIREAFGLPGVPIRLILKRSDNPYTDE
jgi:GTP-binding protein